MCESWRVCHSCGREVKMSGGQSLGEAMCGWLVLSYLKEEDNFDRFSFCSLECLQRWTQSQMPAVPEVFLQFLDGTE